MAYVEESFRERDNKEFKKEVDSNVGYKILILGRIIICTE